MTFFLDDSLDILIQLIFLFFDDSFDIRDYTLFDIYFVHFFDVRHFAVFFWRDERDRRSFFSSSSCPSYPVRISFCILRYRIIDDVRHIIHIYSSGSDIGSYENLHFFVFETLEKMLSLFLR